MKPNAIPAQYFQQEDTLTIAKQLLGATLSTNFNGQLTSIRIVETEAYLGVTDRASHAWNGRHTNRTSIMYLEGGIAYVYLIYGMHHLFNIVTGAFGTPHAILIRAGEPLEGLDQMLIRRNKKRVDYSITKGPGSLAQAMGIKTSHTGIPLNQNAIWITAGKSIPAAEIIATPRIGVDYAGEDADLPYRFIVANSPYISGSATQNCG